MNRLTIQLDEIRAAYAAEPHSTIEKRLERIGRVEAMLRANEEKLCKAVAADFGHRHPIETQLAELNQIYQTCRFTKKHLKEWLKPIHLETPTYLSSSIAWMQAQPKGIVGIISPWNYPVLLTLAPAIAALAAGNRVWLKPSERSSRTSGFLATLIQEYFHFTEFSVTTGDANTAADFAALPFDHLFFSGSAAIGKKVMSAAAENLVPVTLELGGKSPVLVDASANLRDAASSIMYGKLLNGGQTCIAPDYVLVGEQKRDALLTELIKAAQYQFAKPEVLTGPIDPEQTARWHFLVEDAIAHGATATPLLAPSAESGRVFEPVALTNVHPESAVMQEEIFGPILPIISVADGAASTAAMINFINGGSLATPLALYWFGKNKVNLNRVIADTRSGGITVNDVLLHAACDGIPFGGIGSSGMGSYHGKAGFDTFSHFKPVLQVRGLFGMNWLRGTRAVHPPYGKKVARLLKQLKK
jgi:coniferyl-aldehyde dehydrogenase